MKTTQNQMLRRIAGPRRVGNETWVEWVQRATRAAWVGARRAGIKPWLEMHYVQKWLWAGHVARMSAERLAHRAVHWRDSSWWRQQLVQPQRFRTTRPDKTKWFRWEDDLRRYADTKGWHDWSTIARQKDETGKASLWNSHAHSFAKFLRR